MEIKKWFEFTPNRMKKSAGVIIILNKTKILLCHATGSKWIGTFGPPKGGLNPGETEIQGAIRELKEETSIKLDINLITNPDDPIIIDYISKSGDKYKRLFFYTVYIDDVSEIGLTSEIIPINKLQKDEIDWCGFLDKKEAEKRIFHRVSSILDLL